MSIGVPVWVWGIYVYVKLDLKMVGHDGDCNHYPSDYFQMYRCERERERE